MSITSCSAESDNPYKRAEPTKSPEELSTITFGGGCFWCVEAVFEQLEGVGNVVSGYTGGHVKDPTYEDVLTKKSGHVEVVQVKFDPEVISLEKVLEWFWKAHDPTSRNKQGNDSGPQYASAIYFENDEQKAAIDKSQKALQETLSKPIVTIVEKVEKFYPAEKYHQDYYELNGSKDRYCILVIKPKLKKLNLKY